MATVRAAPSPPPWEHRTDPAVQSPLTSQTLHGCASPETAVAARRRLVVEGDRAVGSCVGHRGQSAVNRCQVDVLVDGHRYGCSVADVERDLRYAIGHYSRN